MEITLPKFPTHLPKTNNKIKANKLIKLNGQSIYNGALSRFGRAIVMNNFHDYLVPEFKKFKDAIHAQMDLGELKYPLVVVLNFYTPINHGNIQVRKGKLVWKPAEPDFEPSWDIDNLASIWMKPVKDSLAMAGIIPNDNVKFIRGGGYLFNEVSDIEDRKLVIKLK